MFLKSTFMKSTASFALALYINDLSVSLWVSKKIRSQDRETEYHVRLINQDFSNCEHLKHVVSDSKVGNYQGTVFLNYLVIYSNLKHSEAEILGPARIEVSRLRFV